MLNTTLAIGVSFKYHCGCCMKYALEYEHNIIIMPFDGQNSRPIVVMNNVSIRHLDKVHEIITAVGAKVLFFAPI